MVEFIGRTGHYSLFADEARRNAVVVHVAFGTVVASGRLSELSDTTPGGSTWGDGEYSEPEALLAAAHLSASAPVHVDSGRAYTVPRGVRLAAIQALAEVEATGTGASPVGLYTAELLTTSKQISFAQLNAISNFHALGSDTFTNTEVGLRGGLTASTWASAVVNEFPEDLSSFQSLEDFEETLRVDPEYGIDFIARVYLDGSGIDRLYRTDPTGTTYVWDTDTWLSVNGGFETIYDIDNSLDQEPLPVNTTNHVSIDAASAIVLASLLSADPFGHVSIDAINSEEANLVLNALPEEDWAFLQEGITAAAEYTPEERSKNASTQVRDKTGRFATVGTRVMISGNQEATGNITKVNPDNATVTVKLDNGNSVEVPGRTVEKAGPRIATPAQSANNPATANGKVLNTSGIIGQPRTPINSSHAQLPGTLPRMTAQDINTIINDWPAWVAKQRASTPVAFTPSTRAPKDLLDVGDQGRALEQRAGQKLIVDAYDHPLLKDWLKRKSLSGNSNNAIWYSPIRGAASKEAEYEMDPDTSDVQPLYLAIVDSDDPRSVLSLLSLVPASSESPAPMTYERREGRWIREPKFVQDLNSPTPPPVVPLDSETLASVIEQVDDSQGVESSEPAESESTDTVAASAFAVDRALSVLYGTPPAMVAAGKRGGGAEKLREYWTHGKGAAKIRWGTPGDWTRCYRNLRKYMGIRAKGYCALRHKEATGMWTGSKGNMASEETIVASAELRALAAHAQSKFAPITASAGSEPSSGAEFVIPIVIPEDTWSGDGRRVQKGALTVRDLPLPLMWQIKTGSGHDQSIIVGRIDSIERVESGLGNARGFMDTSEHAREAERMIRSRFLNKVSADLDMFEANVDSDGEDELSENQIRPKRTTITTARVMGVTIVAKPAFQECTIELVNTPNQGA